MDQNHVIFSDEAIVRLNSLKRHVSHLSGKRKVVRTVNNLIKVNVSGCFSSSGFGHNYCFRGNLNADLLCKIYKCCLLPTARNENLKSGHCRKTKTPKHMYKLANEWRLKHEIHRIQWPSISSDLNPTENLRKLLKMNLARKKIFELTNH